MIRPPHPATEYALLGLLALLWGTSYLFIRLAVVSFPPLTLIAIRVSIAAVFLLAVLRWRGLALPRDPTSWRQLGIQAFMNSIGAWTILAWGQQFVGAGLASVLNSTSPVFVILFSQWIASPSRPGARQLFGATLGMAGVILIVGPGVLAGLGQQVVGQLACLAGAALYAGAAHYGRRFAHLGAAVTATGTMICATVVLVPLALALDRPWQLVPSAEATIAALLLTIFSTALALIIYFRLIRTIGPLGTASQSYLRAGVGVALGILILGESLSIPSFLGIAAAILGVVLINAPKADRPRHV